jgi:hypothetical protein
MPLDETAIKRSGKGKESHDSDEEPDTFSADGDCVAAELRAADPAHRKQIAAAFREHVQADMAQMRRFSIESTLELEFFIPRCCRTDDVMYSFALSRAYDFESASKRYFNFCDALNSVGVTSLTEYTEDVAAGVREGWALHAEPSLLGHPVQSFDCRDMRWSCTVRQMCHATIFMFWRQATLHGYSAQIHGGDFVFYLKTYTTAMFKMEYETWCAKLMQGALPMKFARMYMVDEDWKFANVFWPMAKLLFQKKMRDRVVWLNTKASGVKGDGKTRRYEQLRATQPPGNVAASHGGEFVYDADAVDAELLQLCRKTCPTSATTPLLVK